MAAACYFSDFCVNLLIQAFKKNYLRKGNLDGNRHLYNCYYHISSARAIFGRLYRQFLAARAVSCRRTLHWTP